MSGPLSRRSITAPSRSALTVTAAYGDLSRPGGGRKWKIQELSPNGKPIRVKVHIKKGDTVQVRDWAAAPGTWAGRLRPPRHHATALGSVLCLF